MSGSGGRWISLANVKAALEKKWQRGMFLREAIAPAGLFPMRIVLRAPTASELSDQFSEARDWVKQYSGLDNNQFFRVEWTQVNHRVLGQNELPGAVSFESLLHLTRFLNKSKELEQFTKKAAQLLTSFPQLKPWVLKNPRSILELGAVLEKLTRVTQWTVGHPRPGIYMRQLSLEDIDTKFVETHKKVLSEWFDILLDSSDINAEHAGTKGFEQRYGFLSKPVLIRFRILDENGFINGFSDLTVRADEFSAMDPAIDTVFVIENDINCLAFPNVKRTIVLFGRGYGFDSLKNAQWLNGKTIYYWGDIDTHGFAILSQFRKHFPQTESFMMDRQTLLSHKNCWVKEAVPSDAVLTNLKDDELLLYEDLRRNRLGDSVRLEQELITYQLIEQCLVDIGVELRV